MRIGSKMTPPAFQGVIETGDASVYMGEYSGAEEGAVAFDAQPVNSGERH